MSSRKGKRVYYKFVAKANYPSKALYEKEIQAIVEYLKTTPSLYNNNQIGTIRVFHNKRGTGIIARDLPDNS